MNNLAAVYEAIGQYEQALGLYENSLHIVTRIFGGQIHPDIARILNNMASVLVYLGRGHDAINNLEKAVLIMEKTMESNSRNTLILRVNLSNLREQIKQKSEQVVSPDARSSRC
jgi:tetratricopeptide (TPR) repeat protein